MPELDELDPELGETNGNLHRIGVAGFSTTCITQKRVWEDNSCSNFDLRNAQHKHTDKRQQPSHDWSHSV
jgi:hypothetical protein